jgi:hypothetical protein
MLFGAVYGRSGEPKDKRCVSRSVSANDEIFYRSSPSIDSAEIQDVIIAGPNGDIIFVQVMKNIILRLLLAVTGRYLFDLRKT